MRALAEAIARDILAERPASFEPQDCFACGRSYSKAAPMADDGGPSRFCSVRCRDYFDAGGKPYDPYPARTAMAIPATFWIVVAGPPGTVGTRPYVRDLPVSGSGCLITCRGCRKPFVSKGLRCCSVECDRKYREQQGIVATMAQVGMEPVGYVRRKCEQYCHDIPGYTGTGKARKETRKDARYCSPKCYEKARWLVRSGKAVSPAKDTQKAP